MRGEVFRRARIEPSAETITAAPNYIQPSKTGWHRLMAALALPP